MRPLATRDRQRVRAVGLGGERVAAARGSGGSEVAVVGALDADGLRERVYGKPSGRRPDARREALDFAAMYKELNRHRILALRQLWRNHREAPPDRYASSQYCEPYREWKVRRSLVMLREHKAGRSCSWTTAGRRCRCGMSCSATERFSMPTSVGSPSPRPPVPRPPPRTARNSADAASPSIPSTCHHRGMGERLGRSAWREPQVYGPASAYARSAVGGTEGC